MTDKTDHSKLYNAICESFRCCGRFPFHFARGKLKHDPVVIDLLTRQTLARADGAPLRLVDLGCGQGLLLAALDAYSAEAACATAPVVQALGIDAMPANVRWGQAMLAARRQPQFPATILQGDIRHCDIPPCNLVLLIDVLHYLNPTEQEQVVARIHAALEPGGHLILRVGDTAHAHQSRISRGADRLVVWLRGQGWRPVWQRPLSGWQSLLQAHGFSVQILRPHHSKAVVNVLMCCAKLI